MQLKAKGSCNYGTLCTDAICVIRKYSISVIAVLSETFCI